MARVAGGMHDDSGNTGMLRFSTNTGGGLDTQMVIDKAGKVGIGTTSPKEKLHVAGDYYGKGHVYYHAHEGDGSDGPLMSRRGMIPALQASDS